MLAQIFVFGPLRGPLQNSSSQHFISMNWMASERLNKQYWKLIFGAGFRLIGTLINVVSHGAILSATCNSTPGVGMQGSKLHMALVEPAWWGDRATRVGVQGPRKLAPTVCSWLLQVPALPKESVKTTPNANAVAVLEKTIEIQGALWQTPFPFVFKQDSFGSRTGEKKSFGGGGGGGNFFPRSSPTLERILPETNGNACRLQTPRRLLLWRETGSHYCEDFSLQPRLVYNVRVNSDRANSDLKQRWCRRDGDVAESGIPTLSCACHALFTTASNFFELAITAYPHILEYPDLAPECLRWFGTWFIHRGHRVVFVWRVGLDMLQRSLCSAVVLLFNPFTPRSTSSAKILHHTVWRTWLFIAYSNERLIYYQFSLPHLYITL